MRLQTRKLLDLAFSGSGILAIALMAAALLILLTPIFIRGSAAIFFTQRASATLPSIGTITRNCPQVDARSKALT